jgi:hypothetical protein
LCRYVEQTPPTRNVMLKNSPGPISLSSFASGPGLSSGSDSCTVKSVQNFNIGGAVRADSP